MHIECYSTVYFFLHKVHCVLKSLYLASVSHQTYFGYDVESSSDEISHKSWKAMIKTYGQTLQQLFTGPHPPAANFGPVQNPQVSVL